MTKIQLINKLGEKFTTVGTETEGSSLHGITHWSIPVFNIANDILIEQTILFYTDESGNAYWQNREPEATLIIPKPSFVKKVNSFIKTKIDTGVIKFGYIENYQEEAKKALVRAIDNNGVEKKAIITEDEEGGFSIDIL